MSRDRRVVLINKFLLYGHGGSSNHGCEAIVRTTVDILETMTHRTYPIVLGSFRVKEDNEFGIDTIVGGYLRHRRLKKYSLRHITTRIIQRISGADISIPYQNEEIIKSASAGTYAFSIGGDNYCYDYPEFWMYINNSLNLRTVKTIFWGCSVEPELLKHDEVIEDMNRYDLITPRESITYEALTSAGVTKNTHLFPDPAFVLKTIELPLPDAFTPGNTVGINVSPLVIGLEKGKNITRKNYGMLIEHVLATTEMNVALIPHVTWEDNNDLEPLTSLFNEFKESGRVVLIGDQYNCMELKGFISRCRFFVGARTHATIAAYSTEVPTLVVGYSVKARGIARDIFGTEENMVIPVQSLEDQDDLVNAFKYIQENEDPIRKHLQEFMPGYIEKAWLAGDEVRKLLEK